MRRERFGCWAFWWRSLLLWFGGTMAWSIIVALANWSGWWIMPASMIVGFCFMQLGMAWGDRACDL